MALHRLRIIRHCAIIIVKGCDRIEDILSSISGEIICALISGAVSWAVANYKTRKEFEKLTLGWNREDTIAFNELFVAMVHATTIYAKHGSDSSWREAMAKVAETRALANDDLAPMLDSLYLVISRKNMIGTDAALSKVISKKRELDKMHSTNTAG